MSQEKNTDAGSEQRSTFERALSLFAEVRAGEGIAVALLFANIFLILTAYYVLKVVREALTIGGVEVFGLPGDEIKAYLPAVMAVLLIGIVPAYGALASRVDRIALIKRTMLVVVAALVGFFLWGSTSGVGTAIGLSFYIFLGIVNVFLIAQFWSYANDVYTEEQGKRLFAIIAIGQSFGAVLGPKIAGIGADHVFLMLALSGGVFLLCLFLYITTNRMFGEAQKRAAAAGGEEKVEEPLKKDGGFALVFSTRYLLYIALMILTTNVVNTTGEYILANAAKTKSVEEMPVSQVVTDLYEDYQAGGEKLEGISEAWKTWFSERTEAEVQTAIEADSWEDLEEEREQAVKDARSPIIGQFYGDFFFYVNLAGLVIQMFFVSRIFKYFGVRAALFVLPVIAFFGYGAIGLIGGLLILRIAKTAENSTDYSLQNTVKQALFLPTSREAKYKAKAAIDTFFVRFGDAASAGIVATGLHVLHFSATGFAFVNVGLCVVWIGLNLGIAREHRKMEPDDKAAPPK